MREGHDNLPHLDSLRFYVRSRLMAIHKWVNTMLPFIDKVILFLCPTLQINFVLYCFVL